MTRFFSQLPRRTFLLVMALGWAFILASSVVYFDLGQMPAFMLEKLPLRFESLWLVSLRIHVAAALVSFPLCLVLMTRTLQRRPQIHRWLGRVAGMTLLLGLVPTGAVLAFDAKGGAVVTAGFLLSGTIVAACTVLGVLAARRHDLVAHRRAMRHVFAQMSVAVTSRALLVAAGAAGLDADLAYVVALWGPVLVSAALVEVVSRSRSRSRSRARPRSPAPARPPSFIERIRREIAPLALGLRSHGVARPGDRLGR